MLLGNFVQDEYIDDVSSGQFGVVGRFIWCCNDVVISASVFSQCVSSGVVGFRMPGYVFCI